MKKNRIIYWVATVVFSALAIVSASMYVFNYQVPAEAFALYGYPLYLIYPLAAAKILGLVAIWSKKSEMLKGMAYAGFFFNGFLALLAHIAAGENISGYAHAIVFVIAVGVSYSYQRKN